MTTAIADPSRLSGWLRAMFRINWLALRVAIFNSVGGATAIWTPIHIDALQSHRLYGPRQYPAAPWFYLAIPIIFVVSWLVVDRGAATRWKPLLAWLALSPLIPVFWAFRPEFPHSGVALTLFATGVLSFTTVWLHHLPDFAGCVKDGHLPRAAMIAQLQGSLTSWQYIAVYASTGYLAFAMAWVAFVGTVGDRMFEKFHDRLVYNNISVIEIVNYSALIIIGPLNEMFRKVFRITAAFADVTGPAEPKGT
jgi:hypothetical protein